MYMDGRWVAARDGQWMAVKDPATGEEVGFVPRASVDDVLAAVDAAAKAFPVWSNKSADERAQLLHRACNLLLQRAEEVARLLTREQGKPLTEARGEVRFAADYLRWYAEEARRVYGETLPASSPDKRLLVIRQPVGVVAAITPWNFPAQMITRKVAPALASGCTVVVKPSEYTP
ncbi:MAG: aldehyde dehydrogenase family protein, partial [Alicyclobacillus sp.]|nr:aldehyde dehydrogenase family protein [Alicyclobacillus sp.]